MEKRTAFRIGLVALAIFIIGAGIWVVVTPPVGDEMQAYAMVAIGIVMIIVGYGIAERDRDL